MAECETLFLVQAEFDGELDAAEAARAMHHRANCPVCRAAYAEFETSRALLRDGAPYHRIPEGLRRAILAGLGAKTPQRPRSPAWWRDGASFVLGAGLAAAIALLVIAPAQQGLIDEIVASHVRALQPGHLEDVVSTDEHTVKPWFDGKVDFAPPVKDLATKNFPLLGGRLDYLDGRPVAALAYGHDKHIIDLYIWPGRDSLLPTSSARNGYNVVHWSTGGMNFWAVSDLEAGQLRNFVEQWRAES